MLCNSLLPQALTFCCSSFESRQPQPFQGWTRLEPRPRVAEYGNLLGFKPQSRWDWISEGQAEIVKIIRQSQVGVRFRRVGCLLKIGLQFGVELVCKVWPCDILVVIPRD
jgi:hypothetical protein